MEEEKAKIESTFCRDEPGVEGLNADFQSLSRTDSNTFKNLPNELRESSEEEDEDQSLHSPKRSRSDTSTTITRETRRKRNKVRQILNHFISWMSQGRLEVIVSTGVIRRATMNIANDMSILCYVYATNGFAMPGPIVELVQSGRRMYVGLVEKRRPHRTL